MVPIISSYVSLICVCVVVAQLVCCMYVGKNTNSDNDNVCGLFFCACCAYSLGRDELEVRRGHRYNGLA